MQEEVTQKTIALSMKTGKLTACPSFYIQEYQTAEFIIHIRRNN